MIFCSTFSGVPQNGRRMSKSVANFLDLGHLHPWWRGATEWNPLKVNISWIKVDTTRNQHSYIINYISTKSGKMSDFKIFQNFGTVFRVDLYLRLCTKLVCKLLLEFCQNTTNQHSDKKLSTGCARRKGAKKGLKRGKKVGNVGSRKNRVYFLES